MIHAKRPEGMRARLGLSDVDTALFMFPAHPSLPLASSPRHVCISDSGQQCRPRLAYDGAHHLSAMCLRSEAWGGGFSGDPQDDFHGPDGSLLPDTETLHSAGRTWAPQVSRSITGPIPLYPHNRVSWHQSLAFCGLTAHNWHFQACDKPARAQIHHVHNLHDPGGSGRSCGPAGELRPAMAASWPPPAAVKTLGRPVLRHWALPSYPGQPGVFCLLSTERRKVKGKRAQLHPTLSDPMDCRSV